MNCNRALHKILCVEKPNELLHLIECRGVPISDRQAKKSESGPFKYSSITWDVQEGDNGANSSRMKQGEVVLKIDQFTSAGQTAFRMDKWHWHPRQYFGDHPPQKILFLR